ncbi:TetR family transcriptional regulator [Streptomyces sp. NPDC057362]|uniref:TetR family transcriptional regulator n=1 Tax=Streptomyces sp. NPDC057362 TaxID=3346106 RepID=UPI0036320A86
MVMQERAARTRAALVRAAVVEFDRNGYDGTSLAKISNAAGISMGALTFHFSSKGALADAVQEEGRALMDAAFEQAMSRPAPALETVVTGSLALTGLIEENTVVRSAMRLMRERSKADCWTDLWLPAVRQLLKEASAHGQLRTDAHLEDVVALTEILTAGGEDYVRRRLETGTCNRSATAQLERVWRLVMDAICAPTARGNVTVRRTGRPAADLSETARGDAPGKAAQPR